MVERCRRLADSLVFQRAVIVLILFNALAMGLECWPSLAADWGFWLTAISLVAQWLFVLEIAVRLAAFGRTPLAFFRSGWNVFDFAVVALSLLPVAGPLANIARMARVLRVGRLVSSLPELRLIIGTMLRSIPSMGHVVVLLSVLIYVYGVIGHHLFGALDPEHWGTLGKAAHTLFVIITLEGWVEIMRASEAATPWAWVYYASFIIVAVFMVINLFIAVVINNLEKVRREEPPDASGPLPTDVGEELRKLAQRLGELATSLPTGRPEVKP